MLDTATGIEGLGLMVRNWAVDDFVTAFVLRIRATCMRGQFVLTQGTALGARIAAGRRLLARTFQSAIMGVLRLRRLGCTHGEPMILCGVPLALWTCPRTNQSTRGDDKVVQHFEFMSDVQWTAFVWISWCAHMRCRAVVGSVSK